MTSILYILGTPLSEKQKLAPTSIETLQTCDLIIGESKPVLDRYLKGNEIKAQRFHLDPPRREEMHLLMETIERLSKSGGKMALLSDVGMPILFDPGLEVFERCKKLGFQIKAAPGPTAWATACAISSWKPPFLIYGFLDRDTNVRERELRSLKNHSAHLVFMETPYRFRKFLAQLIDTFGEKRPAFLAWEIAKEVETYYWGTLREILRYAESHCLEKGEFVLLLRGQSSVK